MTDIDKFEITSIEKETIKMRLLFTVAYFKDRVIVREDYVNKIFEDYNKELDKNEILNVNENDDEVWNRALLAVQLVEIQYRMMLMFTSLVYQMFEQFLINIIIEKLGLKKGLYFSDAQKIYNEYGFYFKNMKSWNKLYELGLLVNVIKHADGDSRRRLQEMRSDYFYDNQNDMIKNTINDMKLNITEKDFFEYCSKIIEFIDDMPESFEKRCS